MRRRAILISAALALLAGGTAHAAMVTISAPTYANTLPGEGFGPVTNVTGPGDPVNTTVLEIEVSDFELEASNETGTFKSMFDTVSFELTAPAGYYITRVSYSEGLWTTASTGEAGGGLTYATGSLSVGGTASTLGVHMWTAPINVQFDMGSAINLAGQPTSVTVSVTNQITAVAFGDGEAWIAKGYVDDDNNPSTDPVEATPRMLVEVAQIPLPASAWLLFTALAGVSVFSRRRTLPGS